MKKALQLLEAGWDGVCGRKIPRDVVAAEITGRHQFTSHRLQVSSHKVVTSHKSRDTIRALRALAGARFPVMLLLLRSLLQEPVHKSRIASVGFQVMDFR